MPMLSWLTREQDIRAASSAPCRLLEEVGRHGNGNPENMLIQGDNLDGLKALLPYYAGKVKCIFIDPPYNTGSAFEYYNDNLEHSIWLSLLYPRLELLRRFLSEDGFFIIHIDDSESHYIKIICDEIFGRDNYQTSIYVKVRYDDKTLKQDMLYHKQIEQALIYRSTSKAIALRDSKEYDYNKYFYYIEEKAKGNDIILGGKKVTIFKENEYTITKGIPSEKGLKEIWASGTILDGNSTGRFFRDYIDGRTNIDGYKVLYKVSDIGDDGLGFRYITGPKKIGATKGKYYQGIPLEMINKNEQEAYLPIKNFIDLSASFGNCRTEGGVEFRSGKKPEEYIQFLLKHFSSANDLVLDSFLGSGTTAAVAHKMGRRYIGIEIGEHAVSHCVPRLQKVIGGEQGGISKAVNWQGGGGFRFYRLGESVFDENGAIRKNVSFASLAAHIWFSETGIPLEKAAETPFLGIHEGAAYYLLYNGILGDKKPASGNVLTKAILQTLPEHEGPKVIYGERSMLSDKRLKELNIIFRQTPYDIKGNREG